MADLLVRASQSAHRAGELEQALVMVEEALQQVDRTAAPLQASQLLLDRSLLRALAGIDARFDVEAHRQAVGLAAGSPDSAEHAVALAWLAFVEIWSGLLDTAAEHAEQAVTVAVRTESDTAQSLALGVRSQTRWGDPAVLEDAVDSLRLARRSGDCTVLFHAAILHSNCLSSLGRMAEVAAVQQSVFKELVAAGSAHEGARLGVVAAAHLLELGQLSECRKVLREVFSIRTAAMWSAKARLFAAQLEVRTGNLAAAVEHQRRAEELTDITVPGHGEPEAIVEILIARGRFASALDLIADLIPELRTYDPSFADKLLLWAARGAAEWMQRDGRPRAESHPSRSLAARRLADLGALRGTEPAPFVPGDPTNVHEPAIGALFAAERARCFRSPRQAAAWTAALHACDTAGLRWDGAVASYRLGEVLLSAGGSRAEAADALRSAHATAREIGAESLRADVESLCAQAHISLAVPAVARADAEPPAALGRLTVREREVLGHLVAGWTYAEIARTLVISEKTVSVHVSNLLRKTGTTNRIEVAALARSLQAGTVRD